MSQYNTQPDSAAEHAGWEAFEPELAPFHPTMDQSGGWNTPAQTGSGQTVGNKAALPPNDGSVFLHAKAGSTGSQSAAGTNTHTRGSAGHSRVECDLRHTCTACSTSFPNNYQLEQHAAKNKHKSFFCTCTKAFTKLSALKRHVEESMQAREHKCPLCDHEFKRPGHVEQHLRLIHQVSKDVIKDLISIQKSQPHQEPGQATVAPAAITAGLTNVQVGQPVVVPAGPRTGPISFSPMEAPASQPSPRPGTFSTVFSGLPTFGTGLLPETPASTHQSFMPQATNPTYPAYQTTAAANHAELPVNAAPDLVGYPATYPAGDLGLFNVDPATMPENSVDAFGLPVLESVFMGESFDFNFDLNFGNS